MLDLAPPISSKPRGGERLQKTAKLAALSSDDLESKYQDLLASAIESCPDLPASRCAPLVGFYFTAGLAAKQMTPSWRHEIELIHSDEAPGTQTIFYTLTNPGLPVELRFPKSPQLRPATIPNTGFSDFEPLRVALSSNIFRHSLTSYSDLLSASGIAALPAIAPTRRSKPAHTPDAFTAFTELKGWLHLTSTQLAGLLGIKRTTPNAWKREGRTPRAETEMRLMRLHRYIADLAERPEASEQLARIRPALPTLTRAIYAQAAISSETLAAAGIDIPFDWRKLNAFQATSEIRIDTDEDGAPLVRGDKVTGTVVTEDEDDLDLDY